MKELRERVGVELGRVTIGHGETIDLLLTATAVGGHALLEGPPGVAKTLLANAFARTLGLTFRRIQFTPDMLPSDLTGTMAVRGGEFAFRPGPVFANVLLADEINRTPPKTQAALLEAMQEGQVTVDGVSRKLPDPFLVIATQNPIEYEGTYPLPEAQLDRFLMKIAVGYPSEAEELEMLRLPRRGVASSPLDAVQPVATGEAMQQARMLVDRTTITQGVAQYVTRIVRRTRDLPGVALGASPRATVHLLAAAKATARLAGRDFVTPDDVAAMALPVLRHRLVLRPEAEIERYSADELIRAAMMEIPVPR